ncbi:hypothetical protein AFLA_007256 [Aspergillus flavus NRRL3357]|nr:hypothetical protein AFLA_007256 [Aspergillus flavus NRRL3357]
MAVNHEVMSPLNLPGIASAYYIQDIDLEHHPQATQIGHPRTAATAMMRQGEPLSFGWVRSLELRSTPFSIYNGSTLPGT